MRYPVVSLSWLPAQGMAIFPFILIRSPQLRKSQQLITHERIHLSQQLELLILPFYLLYLFNYLFNLAKFRDHHRAYRMIVFEQEAFRNDHDANYPSRRKSYAWTLYIR